MSRLFPALPSDPYPEVLISLIIAWGTILHLEHLYWGHSDSQRQQRTGLRAWLGARVTTGCVIWDMFFNLSLSFHSYKSYLMRIESLIHIKCLEECLAHSKCSILFSP